MANDEVNILEPHENEFIHEHSTREVGCFERLRLQRRPWKVYLEQNIAVCSIFSLIPVGFCLFSYLCVVLFVEKVYPQNPELGYLAVISMVLFAINACALYCAFLRKHPPLLASKYGEPIYGVSRGFFMLLRNPARDSPDEDDIIRHGDLEMRQIQRPVVVQPSGSEDVLPGCSKDVQPGCSKDVQLDGSSSEIQPDGSSDEVQLVPSLSGASFLKSRDSSEHSLVSGEAHVKAEVHRSATEIISPLECCSHDQFEEFEHKSSDNDPLLSSESPETERGRLKRKSKAESLPEIALRKMSDL